MALQLLPGSSRLTIRLPALTRDSGDGRGKPSNRQEASMTPKPRIALLIVAVALIGPSAALAQDTHKIISVDAVKWGPPPPALPKGALMAVLWGNPEKPGTFIL